MIYFTSDLHLGHLTVLKNRPQFETIEELNETLIKNVNSTITKRDILYILGDLSNRVSEEYANDLISKIKGHKILIRGNHDREYDPALFEEITDYKEIKYNKKIFILCHYPFICWKRMRFGSINLHGHIHSNPAYNERNHQIGRLQYDVGVDANNFRPVSIEEIEQWADSSPWQEYREREHHTERE